MNKINNNFALKQEAELENTSGDRLKELAAINDCLAQIVASNIAAPPELSKELVSHQSKAVRKAVVSNPNTSLETLFKLGAQYFPRELFNNPIFQLSYLENPGFVKNIPFYTLHALIQLEDIPTFLLNYAQKGYQRHEVVKNPQCTLEIRETIFKNLAQRETSSFLRYVLFLSDYAGSSVLAKNSDSISWLERYAIAQNAKIPENTLKQLAQDGNRIVRATAKESLQKLY